MFRGCSRIYNGVAEERRLLVRRMDVEGGAAVGVDAVEEGGGSGPLG